MKFVRFFLINFVLGVAFHGAADSNDKINWSFGFRIESINTLNRIDETHNQYIASSDLEKMKELEKKIQHLRGVFMAQLLYERSIYQSVTMSLGGGPLLSEQEKEYIAKFLPTSRVRLLRELENQIKITEFDRSYRASIKAKRKNRIGSALTFGLGSATAASLYFWLSGDQHLFLGTTLGTGILAAVTAHRLLNMYERWRFEKKPFEFTDEHVTAILASRAFWDGFKEASTWAPAPDTLEERLEWLKNTYDRVESESLGEEPCSEALTAENDSQGKRRISSN